MDEKTPRATRSDKGKIQLTERDLHCLRWIAEQYAARMDHVHQLLSPPDRQISETRLRQIVARWQAAGWIEQRRWLADEPSWLWVTGAGLRMLGLDDVFKAGAPAVTRLRHIHGVNHIRLRVENDPRQFVWQSERWLKSGIKVSKKGVRTGSIPDALIENSEALIAIEVELSTKKREDLRDKIIALAYKTGNKVDPTNPYRALPLYTTIWFFVPTDTLRDRIMQAKKGLEMDAEQRVQCQVLKELGAEW